MTKVKNIEPAVDDFVYSDDVLRKYYLGKTYRMLVVNGNNVAPLIGHHPQELLLTVTDVRFDYDDVTLHFKTSDKEYRMVSV